jgi:hypothetical protein
VEVRTEDGNNSATQRMLTAHSVPSADGGAVQYDQAQQEPGQVQYDLAQQDSGQLQYDVAQQEHGQVQYDLAHNASAVYDEATQGLSGSVTTARHATKRGERPRSGTVFDGNNADAPDPGPGYLIAGATDGPKRGTVRVFRQKFTFDDAIGSHSCSIKASKRVTNGIPLGCPPRLKRASV